MNENGLETTGLKEATMCDFTMLGVSTQTLKILTHEIQQENSLYWSLLMLRKSERTVQI